MSTDETEDNETVSQLKSCNYLLPHIRGVASAQEACHCSCSPPINEANCHCASLSNRWTKDSLAKRHKHPRQKGLIGYIRVNGGLNLKDQKKTIDDFCRDNEYYLKGLFIDHGKPGASLQEAMQAVDQADGLIACDLDRFVEHADDRLRDLRPFIHHFFCHTDKHLITVEEGVDTGSTAGQANAISVINQVKEYF